MGILPSQGASVTQGQPNRKERKAAKKGVEGERDRGRESRREREHISRSGLVHSEALFLILVLR